MSDRAADSARTHPRAYQTISAVGRVIACICIAFVPTGCRDRGTAPSKPSVAHATTNPDKFVEQPGNFLRVSAEDLDAEFDADRAAAEAKYKNKVIEVSGTIKKIDDSDPNEVTVELQVEGDDTVDCDFPRKDARQLANLKKGQAVVIRGKCIGLVEGTVTLEKCSVVK